MKGKESKRGVGASYLQHGFQEGTSPGMVRRSRSSRRKKGGCAAGFLFGFLVLAALAAAGVVWLVLMPAGQETEVFVEIAPGSASPVIAAQLEKAGVIRNRFGFDLVRLLKRGRLKAGEYRFDHPANVLEVYKRIVRGDVFTIPVTIPEGATRFDIADRIEKAGLIGATKEDFLNATEKETSLVADLDPRARSLEGYLFPDTYRFQRKATAAQIAAAMVHRFRTATAQLGLDSEPTHSVVTLASLVERETSVNSERPLVASVLSNRLARNMPLMTDPAVIYGLQLQGKWRGTIYASDLAYDTAYNTYRHTGLPPGPVANPGLPSLRAALNPAHTAYLYFVAAGADPQGRSRFAETLEEHNRNVASYRQAVKQAGGR